MNSATFNLMHTHKSKKIDTHTHTHARVELYLEFSMATSLITNHFANAVDDKFEVIDTIILTDAS